MKTRGLIIAVAVLATLSGVLYWSNRRQAAADATAGTPEAPRILTMNSEDVTRVDIQRNRTEKVTLAKQDSGDWQVAETPPLPADSSIVSSLLFTLSALNSDRLVEAQPGELAPYGLAPPVLEAEVRTKDGKTNKLLLGDSTPAGTSTFAMLAGDPRLFTVSTFVKNSLDKSSVDFANKKLFEFGFAFPEKVEMRIRTKPYLITFANDEWLSNGTKMDATSVQSVIARIRDLLATGFAASGFGQPVIEFTVTSDGGNRIERVAVSRSGSNYLARREGRPALYVVDAALIADLERFVGEMKPAPPPAPEASAAPSAPGAPPTSAAPTPANQSK